MRLGHMTAMVVVGLLIGVALWLAGAQRVPALGLIVNVRSFVPFLGPVMVVVPAVPIVPGGLLSWSPRATFLF